MTTTQIDLKQQTQKSSKKKQASFRNVDIGTPLRSVQQRPKKQQHEVLSDWSHAS